MTPTAPFTFSQPQPGDVQQLTFNGVFDFEGLKIHLTALAVIDTREIDTSAGDVTITTPVDIVECSIRENSLQKMIVTIFSNWPAALTSGHVGAACDVSVIDHCKALAAHLFKTGLTTTFFNNKNEASA